MLLSKLKRIWYEIYGRINRTALSKGTIICFVFIIFKSKEKQRQLYQTRIMYLIGKGVFIVIVLIVAMRLQPSEAKLFPIAVRLPLLGTPARDGESLWPMPSYLQTSPESMYINRFLLRKSYDGSLNVCEREIMDKLWSHYQNVLFPPKLSYKFAGSNERKMEYVEFNLKISTPINGQGVDCSIQYYPYFNDNNAEACTFRLSFHLSF